MQGNGIKEKEITIEQLLRLRQITESISELLEKQLKSYIETLQPLFLPRKLLGDYIKSAYKEKVPGADQAIGELSAKYKAVCDKPFRLSGQLETPLAPISNQIEVYPWEYVYEIEGERGTKSVTITSPVKWVLTYRSGYSLNRLGGVLKGQEEWQEKEIRQFLINALVMNMMVSKVSGIKDLMAGLRYRLDIETSPDTGKLPLVTITSFVPSFRPPDNLILSATQLAGVTIFMEIIDIDAIYSLCDPLKSKIEKFLE
ncbi:MAG: hypothetical protein ACC630_06470 [Nitrospinota bacterium]